MHMDVLLTYKHFVYFVLKKLHNKKEVLDRH